MTAINSNSHKSSSFKLSTQVKNELQKKGFSSLFNYQDFAYYKAQAKRAFNKAHTISELFIQDNQPTKSDYNGYIF